LKILPFLPGRDWKKKGLPLFAKKSKTVVTNSIGKRTTSPKRDNKKSNIDLIMVLYIFLNNFNFYFN
jgi:hypothetical protein